MEGHMSHFGAGRGSYSGSSSGHSEESYDYEDAEWLKHVGPDGSLLYVESYVSSTVWEKQAQALKAAGAAERKPAFSLPSKDIKKQNKLLGLLKRRPSVRVKGSPRLGLGGEVGAKGGAELSPAPKVTFRDNPSGEVRRVRLQVYEGGNNLGRRASLCETVLGLVPGRFSEPPDSRVMVAGLVPGSHALRNGAIKIGDWLKEVEGTDITWDNLDEVLAELQIPSMITLSVQKCASETLPDEAESDHKRVTQTQLVKVVTGVGGSSSPSSQLQEIPHTILYLSLVGVTEDSPDGADIRYQFPNWSNKLVKVRGMFITAAHTVQEVAGAPALCSTVCVDEEYYHVAYTRENNDILLLALPHTYVSSHDIVGLMEQVSTLIKFEFGSLIKGFGTSRHKGHLDHLMSHVLGQVLGHGPQDGLALAREERRLNPYLPLVPITPQSCVLAHPTWLILHDYGETKLQIDNCLSELESGDFGDEDTECGDSLMLYNIVGSCLFYKGLLVSSHLSPEEMRLVWLLTSHHGLLSLTAQESVSQLVGWRRVYLPGEPGQDSPYPVAHYLLLSAMNHCLLAVLLESGSITEMLDESAGPDPILVDQVEASLYHLHALHVNAACEESLTNGGIETISADDKFGKGTPTKKHKERTDSAEGGLRLPDVPSILKQKSSVPHDQALYMGEHIGNEWEEEASEDSITHSSRDSSLNAEEEGREEEPDDDSESDWRIFKPTDSRGLHQYDFEVRARPNKAPTSPIRVTCGEENVLFHLLQLEVGEGVLIEAHHSVPSTPPASHPTCSPPPLHAQILHNFQATCGHIHHVLQAAARSKDACLGYQGSSALSTIKEHGVLFHYTPPATEGGKRRSQTFSYWVVGRLLAVPYQREVYVCYHESVPQNLLELAFKVSLGCVV
ncbi:protein inturned-like isoform X2 [Eriocheir sinensis]|uniref:protein inturned-like isoform X2 n=1 Tax=Eriocheir sinensis TaxID=95602 RepID=UPI0021C6ECA9|nr:protein inturned-like isoform X2 [Eriocheir sinensis]